MAKKYKSIHKNIRITAAQQEHINKACQFYGIKDSEYIRRLIDADISEQITKGISQEERQSRKQMLFELNKIGANINQIVKNVNIHYYTDYEKKKLFSMMMHLTELVSK